ncbi:MAG: MBL fold metallo-hydrolase [Bacteroidota bacterium]
MIRVAKFVFSPFQENTYVVHDETKSCLIFDPGCQTVTEQQTLRNFIEQEGLTPIRLINTHCHIDHIFGNQFVHETYGLLPEYHEGEQLVLDQGVSVSKMYGIPYDPSPSAENFLKAGESLHFGNHSLELLFTPGHSPASLSFFSASGKFVIGGDVLFAGSIGRTDLPGGHFDTLIESIKTQLFPLGDDITVYSGHGPETTIGRERVSNPFLT